MRICHPVSSWHSRTAADSQARRPQVLRRGCPRCLRRCVASAALPRRRCAGSRRRPVASRVQRSCANPRKPRATTAGSRTTSCQSGYGACMDESASVRTRVLLARHGEAAYETGGSGDSGGSLTAAGRGQAHRLGHRLKAFCSPLPTAAGRHAPLSATHQPRRRLPASRTPIGERAGTCEVLPIDVAPMSKPDHDH